MNLHYNSANIIKKCTIAVHLCKKRNLTVTLIQIIKFYTVTLKHKIAKYTVTM